jgi:hypothetical protein
MGNRIERHDRVAITNRYVEVDGAPAIPVTGELHYSRVPREEWDERLALMRASGVTTVASYLLWIHHEETRGEPKFDGNRDVAAFVRAAAAAGLDVVLRIGPWCHGEVRNGGFPDWVVESGAELRTDDAAYLALVGEWFDRLGGELAALCGPRGNVVGIQLENELYDRPDHLLSLKRLARASGLHAPLWTATGWGGAELPRGEVIPLFAAYSDGFWVDAGQKWDDTFHSHFFFSEVWDDPGVGADQLAGSLLSDIPAGLDPSFPPATCEMGGGMATAYQRRPWPDALDIAAIANVKLGNGSAWQGFYMYAGGVNPAGRHGMQESHTSGYPNDMPRFDYDFHAPIGATGRPGPTLGRLREHNLFAAHFGPQLALMPATLPEALPTDLDDAGTLRWSLRSDGATGFVFIGWHQPHLPLQTYRGAQFDVVLSDRTVTFPDEPVDIPPGTVARWPVGLRLGGVTLDWATATPFAVLPGEIPTLVLRASPGIAPRARWDGGEPADLPIATAVRIAGRLDVLVLDDVAASEAWVLDGRLLRSAAPVWLAPDGLMSRSIESPAVERWDAAAGHFVPLDVEPRTPGDVHVVHAEQVVAARPAPDSYGEFAGRASAPSREQFDAVAAVWHFALPSAPDTGDHGELVIDWAGDVAELRHDGVTVADRFWDGDQWRILLPADAQGEWTLHISPLRAGGGVSLTERMAARVPAGGAVCELDSIGLERSVLWQLGCEEARG